MIFTRRFGALAARPQFPDAIEADQELDRDRELDLELDLLYRDNESDQASTRGESAA